MRERRKEGEGVKRKEQIKEGNIMERLSRGNKVRKR